MDVDAEVVLDVPGEGSEELVMELLDYELTEGVVEFVGRLEMNAASELSAAIRDCIEEELDPFG